MRAAVAEGMSLGANMQLSTDDPFLQGHSKLYQRRKEIEAELRREFNLPEEDVLMEMMHGPRHQGPLIFGRPPPVPKPRRNPNHLPKIPRVLSEPPRTRWGNIEEPQGFLGRPHSARDIQEQWLREEQQRLRHRSLSPEPVAPPEQPHLAPSFVPQPPPGVPPLRADWRSSPDRVGPGRPNSWRQPQHQVSAEAQAAAQLGPAARLSSAPRSVAPSTPRVQRVREAPTPCRDRTTHAENAPHIEKARELEELAHEYQQKHKARQEEDRRYAAEREAFLVQERRAEEEERERRRRLSEEKVQEAKRQEERRFEELREKELQNRQREAEEAERRRNDQADWERELRKRFKEEENQRKQNHQQDIAEIEKQEKIKAQLEQERAARIQQECKRQEDRSRDRELERERWRKQLEEEAKRHHVAAAAFAEAEKLKRNMQPPGPSCHIPSPCRGRKTFRPEGPDAPPCRPEAPNSSPPPGAYHDRSSASGPSEPPHKHRSSSVPPAPAPSTTCPADEALRQAELAAMQQLKVVQRLPTKEERQRAFKDLLRAWHPDKNPQSVEVATAVFQRLQAERKKVLG